MIMGIIETAFKQSRTTILLLIFLLFSGGFAYINIPKEANPDVKIPMIYVSVALEGISPEDSERLLVKPLEKELSNIKGLKEMRSNSLEGFGSIILEFNAGFDNESAYRDVQDKVNSARSKLPETAKTPRVQEINISLFPVISVALSASLSGQELLKIARDLQDKLEAVAGVLEVKIQGERVDLLEIVIEPSVLDTYGLKLDTVLALMSRNNQLVSVGNIENTQGKFTLKIPGTMETLKDFLTTPVKVIDNKVVVLGDIASIQRSYKDVTSLARFNGESAITLEVSKRVGENIIFTIDDVKKVVNEAKQHYPQALKIDYQQDQSVTVISMLSDLENSVLLAVVIVVIVMIMSLGIRSSLLVCLSIPGSFLIGIWALNYLGYTLNMITLFSLILVVGMLVDDAIVITELADRKMVEGMDARAAYAFATQRMIWPITSSTLTKIVVFLPLLFWPGVTGDFMKYLPITVILALIASWIMAMIFVPVLGAIFGKAGSEEQEMVQNMRLAEEGDITQMSGHTGFYVRTLRKFLIHPWLTLMGTLFLVVFIFILYAKVGQGVEFFPNVEPDFAQIQIRARGDLSIYEKDKIVAEIEKKVLGTAGVKSVYASVYGAIQQGDNNSPDLIGLLQLEFTNWQTRSPARQILEELRLKTQDVAGVILNFQESKNGPSQGLPIQIEVAGNDPDNLLKATAQVRAVMDGFDSLRDIKDNRPLPGIEWQIKVNREEASRFGADVATIGATIQMMTRGVLLTKYHPNDVRDEVDVVARLPINYRYLDLLGSLTVSTANGLVPMRNFIELVPKPSVQVINRNDKKRVYSVESDVKEGFLASIELNKILNAIKAKNLPEGILIKVKGEDKDQKEAGDFLKNAFITALCLMFLVLLAEFNSFYQSILVMSAIFISTAGVLLGMLVTHQAFGIVMGGIGVIALAGIVVNNNIVLIDAYNSNIAKGEMPFDAVLRAAAQRLRPVFLTSATTILGLLPMVLQLTINFIDREVSIGAPSTQWWTQLAGSIAGGMTFASILTLIVTPCMLVAFDQKRFERKLKKI